MEVNKYKIQNYLNNYQSVYNSTGMNLIITIKVCNVFS